MNKFWTELNQIIEEQDKSVFEGALKWRLSVFTPHSYEELEIIGIAIRDGHTAVLNLEYLDNNARSNALFFCLGCMHASRGSFYKVNPTVIVFLPERAAVETAI